MMWIGVAGVLGLGSALAWGGSRMGGTWAWVRPGKWVKLMSMVLLVMMGVALVRLLVGAMRARGERVSAARGLRADGARVAGGAEVAGGAV